MNDNTNLRGAAIQIKIGIYELKGFIRIRTQIGIESIVGDAELTLQLSEDNKRNPK